MGPNVAAHKMVRKVALGIAQETYSRLMRNNRNYEKWKKMHPNVSPADLEKEWCRIAWPSFIEKARATLAEMLDKPRPEHLKEEILDALIKDNELRAGKIKTVTLH